MRDFPDFLGIGAQKAGTTWVHENLVDHPEIGFPPMKEVHFWDMFYDKVIDWYKSLFSNLPHKIKGEITPAYAILSLEKIREIYKLNPELRIFFIARNPIDRAWSAALMDLKRAGLDFDKTPDQWFLDNFNSPESLAKGDYQQCLQNWLAIFPKKQVLLLNYEGVSKNPKSFLQKICNHIGANENIHTQKINKKVFSGTGQSMKPSLKSALEEIYKDKIVSFGKYAESLDL